MLKIFLVCTVFTGLFTFSTTALADWQSFQKMDQKIRGKWESSEYGYKMLVPFHELSLSQQKGLADELPLSAIGAMKTKRMPYRASATYLGESDGFFFFKTADHVGERGAYAVEFGQVNKKEFSVPIDPTAVIRSSIEGDVAIFVAKADISEQLKSQLRSLKTLPLSFLPIPELFLRYPEGRLYLTGRASYPAFTGDIKAFPKLWSSAKVKKMWQDAAPEAKSHLDERTPDQGEPAGDLFVIAPARILAGGYTARSYDMDGLQLETPGGTPYVQAANEWNPQMWAVDARSGGRMSGGAGLFVTPDGIFDIGTAITTGMPQDLKPVLKEVKDNPARVLGKVVVEEIDGKVNFVLKQTAPFSYMSPYFPMQTDFENAMASGKGVTKAMEALRKLFAESRVPASVHGKVKGKGK